MVKVEIKSHDCSIDQNKSKAAKLQTLILSQIDSQSYPNTPFGFDQLNSSFNFKLLFIDIRGHDKILELV